MNKRYFAESNFIYKLIGGYSKNVLEDHNQGKITLLTSSLTLTDQFNNDKNWERNKMRILELVGANNIAVINTPDMIWHTDKEEKSLPGPFTIGISQIAEDIWGGDDGGGIRDIIGREMFSNFDDMKRRASDSETERRRFFGHLCDIYQVICAIKEKVDYIITNDGDIRRAKTFIFENYNIKVIAPEEYEANH